MIGQYLSLYFQNKTINYIVLYRYLFTKERYMKARASPINTYRIKNIDYNKLKNGEINR